MRHLKKPYIYAILILLFMSLSVHAQESSEPDTFSLWNTNILIITFAIILVQSIFIVFLLTTIRRNNKTEKALQSSESKLRAIFENSAEAIGVSKLGRHVTVNQAYLDMFDYQSDEELRDKPILDLIAPNEHTRIKDYVQKRVTKDPSAPSTYETRGRKKDGTEFDMEARVSIYEMQQEVYTVVSLRDITERLKLNNALSFVAQKGWREDSDNLISSLVKFLGEQLGVASAFVGILEETKTSIKTLALYANGEIGENIHYALENTPCHDVIGRELCYYPQNVQELFPKDIELQEMGIEGYMGMPLWGSNGSPLGIIVLLDTKPLYKIQLAKDILQIIADRVVHEIERQQAEDELRATNNQLNALLNTLPDRIIIFDEDGRYLSIHSGYAMKLIYSESPIGKLIGEVDQIPKIVSDLVLNTIREVLESGKLQRVEYSLPDPKDPSQMEWTEGRAIPLQKVVNGKKTILWVTRNLTDYKRAEKDLQIQVDQYQAITSTAMDGFWVVEPDSRLSDVNETYAQMIGYSREDLLKMSVVDLEAQETPEETQKHIQHIIEFGADRFESQHRHKDGHIIDVEISTIFMPQTQQFLTFLRDVTTKKLSEQLLQARLRLSEFALNHTVDELMQKTLDEAEILTNSQIGFFHFLDTDQETLTLQAWSTNTLENMCKAEAKGHHYPISEAGVWVDCVRQRKPVIHNNYESLSYKRGMPEGHAQVVRELVVPVMRNDLIVTILGVGNKPYNYIQTDVQIIQELANMAWDIIARKKAEHALLKSEELLVLKDRFLSIVSHEFRTPLAVIQNSSDLLRLYGEKISEERRQKSFQQIKSQIKALTDMIDDILAAGRKEFRPALVELESFCRTIFEQTQFTDTAEHHFEFTSNISDEMVLIDGDLMQHILSNLLTNAIKYSPKGSSISFGLDSDEKNISMTICDEGIGIPEEDLALLFDPFHRASNVGDAEGSGMGLSIVKEYVNLHGGIIEVESEVGKGSLFRVIIPKNQE